MRQIETLAAGNEDALVTKAKTLLTGYWSAASWRGRAKILTAAVWLIRIRERNNPMEERHASDRFRAGADGMRHRSAPAAE